MVKDELLLALNKNPISRAVMEKCNSKEDPVNPEPALILLELSELLCKKKYSKDKELIDSVAGLLYLYFRDKVSIEAIQLDVPKSKMN